MCDVLLLEDQPELLDLMQLALEMRGYDVRVCGSAGDALGWLAADGTCKVIVTDIDLGPGMDGVSVVEAARRRHPDVRVLFYSGHAAVPRGLDEGERFLEKPFSRLALFDLLDELGVQPSRSPLPH